MSELLQDYYDSNNKQIDDAFVDFCFNEGRFENRDQSKMFWSDTVFWEFVETYKDKGEANGNV